LFHTSRVAALKDLYNFHLTLTQQNVAKEEVAASMTYFSFSLEEFAREILDVIDVLRELKSYKQLNPRREWWWLVFWSRSGIILLIYLIKERTPRTYPIPMPKHEESPHRPENKRGVLKYRLWKAFEKLRKPEIKFAVKVGLGAVLLALPAFTQRYRDSYTHWRGEWALLSYFVVLAMGVGATTSTGFWRSSTCIITDFRILGTSIGAVAAIIL
jgi:hypothetical protein